MASDGQGYLVLCLIAAAPAHARAPAVADFTPLAKHGDVSAPWAGPAGLSLIRPAPGRLTRIWSEAAMVRPLFSSIVRQAMTRWR